MVTHDGTGLAKGDDLGMGGGIVAGKIPVPALGNDFAVANDDGSDWDFSHLERTLGGAERGFHVEFVGSPLRVVARRSLVVGQNETVVDRQSCVVSKAVSKL
jgi:hypothetical protein